MKSIFPSLAVVFFLAGCAGGFPPTSSNGLNSFDMIWGYKEVPKGADTSRVWSPVHQIYGGKPDWSVVWFKEKTKNGDSYKLTARPSGEMAESQTNYNPDLVLQQPRSAIGQITESASLLLGQIKGWFQQISAE